MKILFFALSIMLVGCTAIQTKDIPKIVCKDVMDAYGRIQKDCQAGR